jgi:acetone carboxylase gamma subunit
MVKGLPDLLERVRRGELPTDRESIQKGDWGEIFHPQGVPERVSLPNGTLVTDYIAGGGGYGDPLDRKPEAVLQDYRRNGVSRRTAESIYGVIFDPEGAIVDSQGTEATRKRLRLNRKTQGSLGKKRKSGFQAESDKAWRTVLRFHDVLEIATDGKGFVIRCRSCGYFLCDAKENYKPYAMCRIVDLNEFMPYPIPSGERYEAQHQEYFCPGCATQLQVDVYCPSLGGDPVLWDTRIRLDQLTKL